MAILVMINCGLAVYLRKLQTARHLLSRSLIAEREFVW